LLCHPHAGDSALGGIERTKSFQKARAFGFLGLRSSINEEDAATPTSVVHEELNGTAAERAVPSRPDQGDCSRAEGIESHDERTAPFPSVTALWLTVQ
jgi:hypothetical protein